MIPSIRGTLVPLLAAAAFTACGGKGDVVTDTAAVAVRAAPSRNAASSGDADLREVNSYRLTMDDVRKWSAIMKKAEAMKVNMKDEEDRSGGDETLDGLEAKINATPKLRDLVRAEGMDTRDFAVITWTMIQAAFIQGALDQGVPMDSLAKDKDINVENVKFLKLHEKEIDALSK